MAAKTPKKPKSDWKKPEYLKQFPNIAKRQYSTFLYNIREYNDFDRAMLHSTLSRPTLLQLIQIPEVQRDIEANRKLWHYRAISIAERKMLQLIKDKTDLGAIKFLLSSLHRSYAPRARSDPGDNGSQFAAQFVAPQDDNNTKNNEKSKNRSDGGS